MTDKGLPAYCKSCHHRCGKAGQIHDGRKSSRLEFRQPTSRTVELIEDFTELLKFGESNVQAARRLGYENPAGLARRFWEVGRRDLATGLWRPCRKSHPTSARRDTLTSA